MPVSIAVAAEAAQATGLGHFVRCSALTEEVAARGGDVRFLLRPDALPWALDHCRSQGWSATTSRWAPHELVAKASADGCHVLVVDSYRVDSQWFRQVSRAARASGLLTVVVDDLADREFSFDVVVNQNANAGELDYLPSGARLLLGPQYALLRRRFPQSRAQAVSRAASLPDVPRHVFVVFGGTDVAGMASTAAQAALAAFPKAAVRVVVPNSADRRELASLVRSQDRARIQLLPRTEDMAKEVLTADLVISAAGSTLWELCCLAAAVVAIPVADNQRPNLDHLIREEIVWPLLDVTHISVAVLTRELLRLTARAGALRDLALRAATVTDGFGATRVLEALERIR